MWESKQNLKEELWCLSKTTESNCKKKDSSSFPARAQPVKRHLLYISWNSPNFLFVSIKNVLLPLLCRDLQVAHHGCGYLTAIFWWFWISPSFLEKDVVVYLFLWTDTRDSVSWAYCLLNPNVNITLHFFSLLKYIPLHSTPSLRKKFTEVAINSIFLFKK